MSNPEAIQQTHDAITFPDPLPPTERLDDHFVERHTTFLNLIKERPINLLFLGDSITRRWVDMLDLWVAFN